MLLDSLSNNIFKKIQKFSADDLFKVDQIISDILVSQDQIIKDITNHIIKSGGKRLRTILTILSAKLFGYAGERHINMAAAVELIHTATLLHDDVVDQSSFRRGLATANHLYHNKLCILVGDFLFSQAFLLMASEPDARVLKSLANASAIIAIGEVKQLILETNIKVTLKEYIEVISNKTAELFAASCKVGAQIAVQEQNFIVALDNFGKNLGIAFQIIDDILDYIADETHSGKKNGNDFEQNKITLPVIIAYDLANAEDKILLKQAFSQKINDKTISFKEILNILYRYDAFKQSYLLAAKYIDQAKLALAIIPESQIKNDLVEILNFASQRKF